MANKYESFGNVMSDAAETAADTIDERRPSAADGLDTAASAIRDRADELPGGSKVRRAARSAADGLSSGADYIRSHDTKRMVDDVQTWVKRNPGPAIAIAACVGFFFGRGMSRS